MTSRESKEFKKIKTKFKWRQKLKGEREYKSDIIN